jgi:hypothetical protein
MPSGVGKLRRTFVVANTTDRPRHKSRIVHDGKHCERKGTDFRDVLPAFI